VGADGDAANGRSAEPRVGRMAPSEDKAPQLRGAGRPCCQRDATAQILPSPATQESREGLG